MNFPEAFNICRDSLRVHDRTTKMDVEGLIAQNIEPIRPGRTFARQHRFKGGTYASKVVSDCHFCG